MSTQFSHLSTELYNADKKRATELDVARGLAVVLMIVEHVNMYFTSNSLLQNPLFEITQNGIGDIAVIFMFLMGMNTIFSRKATPYRIFLRGCKIFLLSYVFNFFPRLYSCCYRM